MKKMLIILILAFVSIAGCKKHDVDIPNYGYLVVEDIYVPSWEGKSWINFTSDYETQETFVLPDSVITDITDARNLDTAMELTKKYAISGLEAVEKACQTSGGRQAAQAMEYIKDNYANPELNLNSVCDYLNISTSRFSAIFKEETGKTFLEVLTSIRMEKAKQLLKQTTMKNYEIAEKVGFSDPHYFSIAFKKATGMSPKEYAKGSEV